MGPFQGIFNSIVSILKLLKLYQKRMSLPILLQKLWLPLNGTLWTAKLELNSWGPQPDMLEISDLYFLLQMNCLDLKSAHLEIKVYLLLTPRNFMSSQFDCMYL